MWKLKRELKKNLWKECHPGWDQNADGRWARKWKRGTYITRDGRNIAFVAQEQFGSTVLCVRALQNVKFEDGESSQKMPLSSKSFRLLHGYVGALLIFHRGEWKEQEDLENLRPRRQLSGVSICCISTKIWVLWAKPMWKAKYSSMFLKSQSWGSRDRQISQANWPSILA